MRISLVVAVLAGAVALAASSAVAFNGAPPSFAGGGPWFNTDDRPLTLDGLRGKVVGVEMWTAGCINCLDVLPHLRQWNARYHDRGFVLVGVHTPEFEHERAVPYVRDAIARLGIAYPVVMDNDYRIWNSYHNNYWPTLYLLDKHGRVRYTHIGEGAYEETEQMISRLLAEPDGR
ncbi:MAG TPA: redoxin family protein [bacterium]|nr:redoxin family protein [bacterium]